MSALPVTTTVCCLREYPVRHGFPFTLAARAASGGWHLAGLLLVADLVFWAGAGLLAAVLFTLVRPGRSGTPPMRHSTHAEPRATEVRAPHDENVGGLP